VDLPKSLEGGFPSRRLALAPIIHNQRELIITTDGGTISVFKCPRRVRICGAGSLAASERRIARMVGDGMTNREIAQALFLTPKTVAYHLTHVYQKLDIPGREQIAAALAGG
jgi:DNA-binding CsgD family transcriptional regulator